MTARRRQRPITIRSERAAARLALLTRDGRSQAEVIEEALERMPLPPQARAPEERLARLEAITAKGRGLPRTPMTDFDAETYGPDGLPR